MSEWTMGKVPLKYQLSDRTLFRVSLPLAYRSVKVGQSVEGATLDTPPSATPLPHTEGFLIRAMPIEGAPSKILRMDGYIRYIPIRYTHSYIDLSLGVEEYQRKFSSKTRSTLRRKIRKYADYCGGEIPWRLYTKKKQMREFHRLARRVSALSYQERTLGLGLPESEQFLSRLEDLATQNRVVASLLFHEETPVSYLCCLAREDALTYDYQGYDPAYSKQSVGTVLFWLTLERLLQEKRFRIFDFTEGESQHKRLFSTHNIECANVFFLNDNLRNRFLVRTHAGVDYVSKRLGVLLDRLGVKARVKRLLRFGRARTGPGTSG